MTEYLCVAQAQYAHPLFFFFHAFLNTMRFCFCITNVYLYDPVFYFSDVGRLLTKNGTVASISSFAVRPPWPSLAEGHLHRPVPSPPETKPFTLKMLPNGLRGGGGQESPPALSPNLPSVVKVEPRLSSPCDAFSPPPGKKSRQDWLPSPPSLDSLSPPPTLSNNNGLSPTSSYDTYCSTKGRRTVSFNCAILEGMPFHREEAFAFQN